MDVHGRVRRILFVCGGNTCRSPMAAGIASALLGDTVTAESAGLSPHGTGAAPYTVQFLREDFGVDISGHTPRNVRDLELASYDVVVALDKAVAWELLHRLHVEERKLVEWFVRDPYGGSLDVYRRTARDIRKLVDNSREVLVGTS